MGPVLLLLNMYFKLLASQQ